MASTDRIILGIDPGTNIMGFGIIRISGQSLDLVAMGVLKLGKITNHADKLKKIFDRTLNLITEFHPDELAIESPFYGKNVQSMLKLGRAQGVAMAAALHSTVPIFEYSPRKIKQSITGRGNASKEQVAGLLHSLLKYEETPEYLDATDALAVAICHYFQKKPSAGGNTYNSWKSFVSKNKDRINEF